MHTAPRDTGNQDALPCRTPGLPRISEDADTRKGPPEVPTGLSGVACMQAGIRNADKADARPEVQNSPFQGNTPAATWSACQNTRHEEKGHGAQRAP